MNMNRNLVLLSVITLAIAGLGVMMLGSCKNSSTTDPIVGTWNLTLVNGSPPSGGGTFTAMSNGTWTAAGSGVIPNFEAGTWSVSSGTYTIINTATSGNFTATISGNTLTVDPFKSIQTYTKQ